MSKATPIKVGDLVCYQRPPDTSDKLASRWIGPAKVVAREGKKSYQIAVKPGFLMGAHRGALKAYTPDKFSDNPIQLFYHRRTPEDPEGLPTSSF